MRASADPHILFIEDDPDDADLARWYLAEAGIVFTCSMVWTADELIEQLEQRCPDLIISDFVIPGFDGWAAFRVARAMVPAVPFIFHSDGIGEARCKIAQTLGAFACIEKDHAAVMVDAARRALDGHAERTHAVG
jgi:CheY-like chemotaxis protein